MALTNFILTVAGVSAVILLMRSDVKQSASIFRRNVRHIRNWLEEESSAAAKEMEKAKPKEIPEKDIPKEDSVLDKIIFAWPRQRGGLQLRELLASRLQKVMTSVGLTGISLDKDPQSLSGGYKRRLALAIQLVQTPDLLVLDEPLAGLDWKARADVVKLLKDLKKELTFLVVSHDLKELASLVDQSWRMEIGGILRSEHLPD